MKKQVLMMGGLLLALSWSEYIQAQSLKDILNSETAQKVLNAVKQVNALKAEDFLGIWQYQKPACQFKSDELLQKAGGIALAEGLEKKLETAYTKAGIVPGKFSYTFRSDSTFTTQMGRKELKGTYSFDPASGILTMKYYSLFSSEIQVVKSGNALSLLFDADRLLKLVTLLSSYSKSTTLNAIGKVAGQYNGMLLGFDMDK